MCKSIEKNQRIKETFLFFCFKENTMDHITSSQKNQLYMCSLDESISTDHPVRFIDAFVEKLDLPKLKFVINSLKKEGRPSYDSRIFLKLYFYGYLNGIRSSRRLEKECERNIEQRP